MGRGSLSPQILPRLSAVRLGIEFGTSGLETQDPLTYCCTSALRSSVNNITVQDRDKFQLLLGKSYFDILSFTVLK